MNKGVTPEEKEFISQMQADLRADVEGNRKKRHDLQDWALAKLRKVEQLDQELAHIEADNILCEVLERLSYTELVEEYNKIDKWYA